MSSKQKLTQLFYLGLSLLSFIWTSQLRRKIVDRKIVGSDIIITTGFFSSIKKINFIMFLLLTSLQSTQHEVTEIQNQLHFLRLKGVNKQLNE